MYHVKFDAGKIIEHFTDIHGAVSALKHIGLNMKYKTLQKQKERGNMPADVVASLAYASVKLGKPMDLYDCLLEDRTKINGR